MSIQSIYLAGGCFWGTQKFFDQFAGVVGTQVGYANGPTDETSYQEVCASSGHAETVRIDFDEEQISPERLLDYFFTVVDPTAYHRQGPDMGIQYRTGIYYTDAALLPRLEKRYAEEQAKYPQKLETELLPLQNFCPAEEYHQKYLEKNPAGYCHIPQKMFRLKEHKR